MLKHLFILCFYKGPIVFYLVSLSPGVHAHHNMRSTSDILSGSVAVSSERRAQGCEEEFQRGREREGDMS